MRVIAASYSKDPLKNAQKVVVLWLLEAGT